MFQKRVKSKSQRCCSGDVAHARSHTSCNQARSASGGGTEGNPVQIILVCFICKHRTDTERFQTFERYDFGNALDDFFLRETKLD